MTRLRVIEFVPAGLSVIAQSLGLFAEAGVEIESVRTRSSTEQRERLMDDSCDVGLTAIDNLIAWDADGDDLAVVGQVERTTVLELYSSPGVTSIEELRGRELAVDATTTGFAIVLRHVLARQGLTERDYELLPAGGIRERMDAVIEGRAAAGLLGPPFNRMAAERGCHLLATVESEVPALPGIGVVVRTSRAPELARPVAAYLQALAGAAAWATDEREEQAVAMLQDAGFDPAGAGQLFAIRARDIAPSRDGLELLFDMRRRLGMLPEKAPTIDALLDWASEEET
jgi:ABC-type nitrate/sulfonate/bicarbonate transport system substrate-binding protein